MPRTRTWLAWLWLAGLYLLLIAISWKRWANPIVDCGREMYVPWQIAEGHMLYRDLFWIYGPFAPYWHALLFKLFGVHLNVLYAAGLLLVAAQGSLVFVIGRRVLSPAFAALAATLFLVQFAVRPTLGNLVFPYSFSAGYASALNLVALWLALRDHESGQRGFCLILAGACVGLSLLSKIEIGLAGFGFLLAVALVPVRDAKSTIRNSSFALLACLALPLAGYGWFASQLGAATLLHEYLWPREVLAEMKLFHQIAVGTLFTPKATVYLIGLTALGAGGFFLVALAGYVLRRRLWRWAGWLWIVFVALGLVASPLEDDVFRFLELNHLYAGNLVFLGVALLATARLRPPVFWIALFALLATWRAPLFAGVSAYSAFFMAASVVVFVWFWAEWLPGAGQWLDARPWRATVAATLAVLLGLQSARHVTAFRTQLTAPIATPRGALCVHREIGPPLRELIGFVEANTRPGEAVLFFPEETSLYFLCDRRSPSKYYQFAPGLLAPERKQRELIADAEAAQVRFVFVSNRATTEYGKPYFGVDYYPLLREWVLAHFERVNTIGHSERSIPPPPPSRYWPSEGYGVDVYQRTAAPAGE
jgi:hypothetical protein